MLYCRQLYLITAFILILISHVSAQLDTLHYIPPLACSPNQANGDYGNHYLWLSTNEATAFEVKITNNSGFSQIVNISQSAPAQVYLGRIHFSSNSSITNSLSNLIEDQARGVVTRGQLYRVMDDEGLMISAAKPFFVNVRHESDLQGAIISSKGTVGLGTDFYSGHVYSINERNNRQEHRNIHFISVMATEDNTFISLGNNNGINNLNEARNSNQINSVRLNKGQSYVIALDNREMSQNSGISRTSYFSRNQLNGTHITSNKPIAVLSGSWTASQAGTNRDMGADQLVPSDVTGNEYIVVKGQGVLNKSTKTLERTIVVATENNTTITLNNTGAPIVSNLNKGEYHIINLNQYNANGTLYLQTNKKVYVYQTLSGSSNSTATAGMVFVPPIKCTSDRTVNISGANRLAYYDANALNPALILVTQTGSQITINGVNVPAYQAMDIPGNTYWEAYKITGTYALGTTYKGNTHNWNFQIASTGALNAALAMETGATGAAGYYSGFGDKPQISGRPSIAGYALCAGDMEINAEAGSFTEYRWYRNGELIPGETSASYTVAQPGRYKVTGLTACNGSTTETFPSNEIVANACISVDDIQITEGSSPTAIFTVTLSHLLDYDDVTVEYETMAATATQGADYTAKSGTAKINAGTKTTTIAVPILDDALNEADEKFMLVLSKATYANISQAIGECTIKDDNDPKPNISTISSVLVEENIPGGELELTITLDRPSGRTTTADYQFTEQSASQTTDYTPASTTGTFTFLPGELTKSIIVDITDDNIYEFTNTGYEDFDFNLSNLQHVNAGNLSTQIQIRDNETIPQLTISDMQETEGGSLHFTIQASHPANVTMSIDYQTIDVTATHGNDYNGFPTKNTLNLSPGNTQATILVPTFSDALSEGAETFTLQLTQPIHCQMGILPKNITGTIFDADGNPQLVIKDASATEGEIINFPIELSLPSSEAITFEFQTSDGTANHGSDYTGSPTAKVFTIPANTRNTVLSIPTLQDTEEESNESFTITLTNLSAGVDLSDGIAIGQILDDDETPIANDDSYTLFEDAPAALAKDVTKNDEGLGDPPIVVTLISDVSHGTLNLQADGTFTYTSSADYHGTDNFIYQIKDSDGDTDQANVQITVTSVNDLPQALNDSPSSIEELTHPSFTALSANVMTNDSGLGDNAQAQLIEDVKHGTLTLHANGQYTYTPDAQYYGSETFTYRLIDNNGDLSNEAKVSWQIKYYNDAAPHANDDNISTNEDTDVAIPVLNNDVDLDGNETIDKATVIIKSQPAHGSIVSITSEGVITYLPDANYNGNDQFTYQVSDQVIEGQPSKTSNIATVNINVTVNNDPPVALCKDITVYLDNDGKVTVNASDIDNGSYDPESIPTLKINGEDQITLNCSNKGNYPAELTATDSDHAQTSCMANIQVIDNIAPINQTTPAAITMYCGPSETGATVTYTQPLFADNCDGINLEGTLTQGKGSPSFFEIGTTRVTYEYTDAAGNGPVSYSFDVTIIQDTEAPSISCPASPMNVIANTSGNIYTQNSQDWDATAIDAQGIQSLTHNYNGGGTTLKDATFSLGTHIITWTASDIHGNTSSCDITVIVSPAISVSLVSSSADNSLCEGESTAFTATVTGGSAPYTFLFFIDGTAQSTGVIDNTFTTTSLTNGQTLYVEVTDKLGNRATSNDLSVTVFRKPQTGAIHHVKNKND